MRLLAVVGGAPENALRFDKYNAIRIIEKPLTQLIALDPTHALLHSADLAVKRPSERTTFKGIANVKDNMALVIIDSIAPIPTTAP